MLFLRLWLVWTIMFLQGRTEPDLAVMALPRLRCAAAAGLRAQRMAGGGGGELFLKSFGDRAPGAQEDAASAYLPWQLQESTLPFNPSTPPA